MAITGVIEVVANPVTGSLVIRYDREQLSAQSLWRELCRRKLVSGPSPVGTGAAVTRATLGAAAGAGTAGRLVETVAGMVIDKLVERSAAALLGALI